MRAAYNKFLYRVLHSFLLPRILKTRPIKVNDDPSSQDCNVFVLICDSDVLLGLWGLKSLYKSSRIDWPLNWLQGGQLSEKSQSILLHHFPGSRVLSPTVVDPKVEALCVEKQLPRLAATRRNHFMMRKLVDPLLLSSSNCILTLDTDILFFSDPVELMRAATDPDAENFYFRDCVSTYSIAESTLKPDGSRALVPRLNAGCGALKKARFSLRRLDELCDTPGLFSVPWVAEQTLHAIYAAESKSSFLSESYLVSQQRGLTDSAGNRIVAKHYPAKPRFWYYREGLRELVRNGFLVDG